MRLLRRSTFAILWAMTVPVMAAPPVDTLSVAQLEERLASIDGKLEQLAQPSLRSGIGAIGYRSTPYAHPGETAWLRIDWGEDVPIDELMLVPAVWRNTETGFGSDGFPEAFRILAGSADDGDESVIAEIKADDAILPRIAPLVIPTPGLTASWVRIETTWLSPRAFDQEYVFQLSECLVFSGQKNVALHTIATTSPNGADGAVAWDVRYVTDGFVPYLMNSARGEQSTAYLSPIDVGEHPSVSIDLEQAYPLSGIQLHAVDQGDTIPQSAPDGVGMPPRFQIEGASQPDFSDAKVLLEVHQKSLYETAPIMMWNVRPTRCRYVRLTSIEPYVYRKGAWTGTRIGFAEIELFSKGENVALGKPCSTSFDQTDEKRPVASVTDGRNLYGDILPLRTWLEQLARRHDLESERPLIAEALNHRYARQKVMLRWMIWLAALLAAGIGSLLLANRILRMRQVARFKERFAADLHDELGADLHTIGLLSDLAEQAKGTPEELAMLHQRIRAVTERTGTALRNCTDLLEANGLYTGLVPDMRRASERIMVHLEHTIHIEGEEHLAALKPRASVDLFLFYKECLVNISRHSGATRFSTQLTATPKDLQLTIRDNGRGLSGGIPSSLKRRAKLLGATITVETPAEAGACIHLSLRFPRFGRRPFRRSQR